MRYSVVEFENEKWKDTVIKGVEVVRRFIDNNSYRSMREIFSWLNDDGTVRIEDLNFDINYEYDITGEYDINTHWLCISGCSLDSLIYMDDFERLVSANKKNINEKDISKKRGKLICYEDYKSRS